MSTTAQITFKSQSIRDTLAIGSAIGAVLQRGDIILLDGELGAGKTHLSKGIVAGTGSTHLVTSPTFVFINEYRTASQLTIFHIDLYRIGTNSELDSIGLADATNGSGICLIEWAERDQSLREIPHLHIALMHQHADQRLIRLTGFGVRAAEIIHSLQQLPAQLLIQGNPA